MTIEDQVLKFIFEKVGVVATHESLIFDDLGISGLDAETFMLEFGETFRVDLSGFDPPAYIVSEYELGNFFLLVKRLIFNRRAMLRKNFSVAHLIRIAKAHKWIEPDHDMNSREPSFEPSRRGSSM